MTTKQFTTQIEGLSPDKPNVHILVIQASNPNGEPLTEGQMDAALNAAIGTLEVVGCEVGATLNALRLDAIGEGQIGRLRIDVAQDVYTEEEILNIQSEE